MSSLLKAIYNTLDFQGGSLLTASDKPYSELTIDDWLEKGEWLAAAKRAGAERIFFVGNNPEVVFAECSSRYLDKEKIFNRIWCLGRPRLLFLASPGEISVLDLAQKPINLSRIQKNNDSRLKILETVSDIKDIAKKLYFFHRDQIESGKVYGDNRFGDLINRADKALIRDLKVVRRELIQAGLSNQKLQYAHALIGRSIFIRYLEDRGIITEDYFMKLAKHTPEWKELLDGTSTRAGLDLSERCSYYARVLENKAFTYALFKSLAYDFNGDMFPNVDEEEQVITLDQLKLIQDLLYGDVGIQKHLFFYSYRFDIVPLDLISSIYEEFYDSTIDDEEKKSKARLDGAYYTPPVLAELTASRILTADELAKTPRVLDPACGSGIFLVEAFRRMVRYKWHKDNERPSFDMLKQLLKNQIAGIEVNKEAVRITAFSLYLAMLHYIEPPAITEQIAKGNRLPCLLSSVDDLSDDYNSILIANAFDQKIKENCQLSSLFGENCADVIISNPPWGAPDSKEDNIKESRKAVMLKWCKNNKRLIGDNESSQAFLWRYLELLKKGGNAAVLVSAGVLFKHNNTTRGFRKQWMNNVRIKEVFNFIHVRRFFFKEAISPFIILSFSKDNQQNFPVIYWSVKRVMTLEGTQAVILSKYDMNIIRNEDLSSGEMWKNYWFGRYRDRLFIKWLQRKNRLEQYVDRKSSGRGYELASEAFEATKLQSLKSVLKLPSRYDPLIFTMPPTKVHRFGAEGSYKGMRVLINEGISEKSQPKGLIIAQFSKIPFCFFRSIYGVKLLEQSEDKYKVLTGILWSSLARYYFFMTSANWGLWHHKLLLDELLKLPVVINENNQISKKIISIVDELSNYHPENYSLYNSNGLDESEIINQRNKWEKELDYAVFDLYDLNEEQKNLVMDFCEVTLPFFYEPYNSIGFRPAVEEEDLSWILTNYIETFARCWNVYLEINSEIHAKVYIGAHNNMVAIEFFPADRQDAWEIYSSENSWQYILDQIGKYLSYPIGTSQLIADSMVHIISSEAIIIIKKNEKRFWTRSLAREDADITLYKRMTEYNPESKGSD
jgi:type I restriction-modification system DNA methylase subunit